MGLELIIKFITNIILTYLVLMLIRYQHDINKLFYLTNNLDYFMLLKTSDSIELLIIIMLTPC